MSPLLFRPGCRLSKALKEGLWDGREELKLKVCRQTKWSESVHNDKGILWPGPLGFLSV